MVPIITWFTFLTCRRTMEELLAKHKKEVKSFEGERRTALKKVKGTAGKGKKGKEALAKGETEWDQKQKDLLQRHADEISTTTTTTTPSTDTPTTPTPTPTPPPNSPPKPTPPPASSSSTASPPSTSRPSASESTRYRRTATASTVRWRCSCGGWVVVMVVV